MLSCEAEEELTAVEAIFPDAFRRNGVDSGEIRISVEEDSDADVSVGLGHRAYVYCRTCSHLAFGGRLVSCGNGTGVVKIRHLPPVKLWFRLEEKYPVEKGPEFTLSCPWASKSLVRIRKKHVL